jgi:uncharacterized protein (TIGR02246 family)
MNNRNSTLIGLLLLTAAAIPGCLSTGNKNNSYLNMVQPEQGAQHGKGHGAAPGEKQAESKPTEAKSHGETTPTEHPGEKQAESKSTEAKPHGETTPTEPAIEVVAKAESPAAILSKQQAPEKPLETTEPKAEAPKLEAKKVPAKSLTPAEKAIATKLKLEQDAVEAIATKWMALVTSGRKTAGEEVADLYTKDAVLIGADSTEMRNSPAGIRSYFNTFTRQPNLAITGYSGNVRVYGDSAVETGYYTFAYNKGEKRETVPARFSIHYRRVDGEWKINDHHSSRLPEASKREGET